MLLSITFHLNGSSHGEAFAPREGKTMPAMPTFWCLDKASSVFLVVDANAGRSAADQRVNVQLEASNVQPGGGGSLLDLMVTGTCLQVSGTDS